jgi:hypothetical protein
VHHPMYFLSDCLSGSISCPSKNDTTARGRGGGGGGGRPPEQPPLLPQLLLQPREGFGTLAHHKRGCALLHFLSRRTEGTLFHGAPSAGGPWRAPRLARPRPPRARSHSCRSAPPLVRFTPDSLGDSVLYSSWSDDAAEPSGHRQPPLERRRLLGPLRLAAVHLQ